MHDNTENIVGSIETLVESAVDYGKTSYDLAKLKTIDKTSDVFSSFVSQSIVFLILMIFLLFLNFGLAYYLGAILENTFYGFFIVAAFYGIVALVMRLFMYKWIKRKSSDYIIKLTLK